MKNSDFPYGSVLKVHREFSLEDIRRKLDDMQRCGMNFVVIWPAFFWWENKASANYPFQTGIEILKHAEQIGMKVIMELAAKLLHSSMRQIFDERRLLREEGKRNR